MSKVFAMAALVMALSGFGFCAEQVLFNFEDQGEVTNRWTTDSTDNPVVPVACDSSSLHATSGTHSLKIMFTGGSYAGIKTTYVPSAIIPSTYYKAGGGWSGTSPETFMADVYVSRTCVVGFKYYQDSTKASDEFSWWEWYALCKPGLNHLKSGFWINSTYGAVNSFGITLYDVQGPETVYVDNIKISDTAPSGDSIMAYRYGQPGFPTTSVQTLGGGQKFPALTKPVTLLGNKSIGGVKSFLSTVALAQEAVKTWKKPPFELPVTRVESTFTALYDSLKLTHPNAVKAVFRQGDVGYDPANPSTAYSGWQMVHLNCHSPVTTYRRQLLTAFDASAPYYGKLENFMRHRGILAQLNVSTIPNRSTILAATFCLVRNDIADTSAGGNSVFKPTCWWIDPCHRKWREKKVNVFRCDTGSYWQESSGKWWWGNTPDFGPWVMAYGQSTSAKGALVLDFTEAVKYWTGTFGIAAANDNNGFFMGTFGDYNIGDYMWANPPSATAVKDRPALFVIYDSTVIADTVAPPVSVLPSIENILMANQVNAQFDIYPNPFTSNVTIRALSQNKISNLEIYDMQGRLVYSSFPRGENGLWTGLDNCGNRVSSGNYLVRINSIKGRVNEKVHLLR